MHKHNNNLHYGVTDIRHTNKQINRPQIETNNDNVNPLSCIAPDFITSIWLTLDNLVIKVLALKSMG